MITLPWIYPTKLEFENSTKEWSASIDVQNSLVFTTKMIQLPFFCTLDTKVQVALHEKFSNWLVNDVYFEGKLNTLDLFTFKISYYRGFSSLVIVHSNEPFLKLELFLSDLDLQKLSLMLIALDPNLPLETYLTYPIPLIRKRIKTFIAINSGKKSLNKK